MKTFTDNAGRVWTVAITIAAVKRVRSLAGVDLLSSQSGEEGGGPIQRLMADPVLLCDVLFAVIQPEAAARNVSDEDFGRSLAGDALEAATVALLDGLVDFFPPGQRAVLAKAIDRIRQAQRQVLTAISGRLDEVRIEPLVEAAVARLDPSTSGPPSTSSPASSGSTPTA